jgi:hypothetical protein
VHIHSSDGDSRLESPPEPTHDDRNHNFPPSKQGAEEPGVKALCEEKARFERTFIQAIRDLNAFQKEQVEAILAGDGDSCRFDTLIFMAQENKDLAKYAWLAHVEEHGC